MNSIKKSFGIRDLENLTGIKAHTIRIWEKRYNLLAPERTSTNIRTYSLASLQKLLNITLLYNSGMKISKIARIPEGEIAKHVRDVVARNNQESHAISALKLAMINFDQALFQKTYARLNAEKSFREIFWEVFLPMLHELGLLWQTDTISPAHEHFITNLIKQKIQVASERAYAPESLRKDRAFVLFLPENEIHEIGLLFLNFELLTRGYQTVYLGASIPLENLADVSQYVPEPTFVSYFTVTPTQDDLQGYLTDFKDKLMRDPHVNLWVLGRQTGYLADDKLPPGVRAFHSIEGLLSAV